MDNPVYKKIYEAVRLCLDLARSPIGYNIPSSNNRLLAISPDYFIEYVSQYCLENISSMTRVYDKNNRLYKNKEVFLEDFIANIIDEKERRMFHDFMWTTDKLKNNILSLKYGDTYPYLSNIAGFNLEVMRYEIRDRWQAIAYIDGSRLGGAVSIKEEILPIDPISFETIHIDLNDLKKGLE
jgi:hypothetical protein